MNQGAMASTDYPSTQDSSASDITERLAETARALFAPDNLGDTLQRVVDLAVDTIDGCDFAGIFILDDKGLTTPVHTDPIVIEIDALQHGTGEGPCLDAVTLGTAFYTDDLGADARWPRFGSSADAVGIRSAMAFPLSADGTRGAVNLYSRFPSAFGVMDRGKGMILAVLADHALASAQAHDDEERQIDNLRTGLVSREVIGQAQGILMERERITADQAFYILRRASQHLNIKLRDVAQSLVDTGEDPGGQVQRSTP
jgi:hypothetical protein